MPPRSPGAGAAQATKGGQPASKALRALLAEDLARIEAAAAGIVAAGEAQRVHELRVACRRARSLLREFGEALDPALLAEARAGLERLGKRSGPVRDLDVWLARSGEAREPKLRSLRAHVRRLRQTALAKLARALAAPRMRRFTRLRAAFEAEPARETVAGAQPIEALASTRIRARAERFLSRGTGLGRKASAQKLHRLRIETKRLRYLLESVGEIAAPTDTRALLPRLRDLQDVLGAFNDREVEHAALERYAEELLAEGRAGAAELLAMGRRQAEAKREQKRLRRRFEDRFAHLAADAALARLCGLGGNP
jgi:CHAD domain-containing protein